MRDCIVSVTQKSKMCLLFVMAVPDKNRKQEFRKDRQKSFRYAFLYCFYCFVLFVCFGCHFSAENSAALYGHKMIQSLPLFQFAVVG